MNAAPAAAGRLAGQCPGGRRHFGSCCNPNNTVQCGLRRTTALTDSSWHPAPAFSRAPSPRGCSQLSQARKHSENLPPSSSAHPAAAPPPAALHPRRLTQRHGGHSAVLGERVLRLAARQDHRAHRARQLVPGDGVGAPARRGRAARRQRARWVKGAARAAPCAAAPGPTPMRVHSFVHPLPLPSRSARPCNARPRRRPARSGGGPPGRRRPALPSLPPSTTPPAPGVQGHLRLQAATTEATDQQALLTGPGEQLHTLASSQISWPRAGRPPLARLHWQGIGRRIPRPRPTACPAPPRWWPTPQRAWPHSPCPAAGPGCCCCTPRQVWACCLVSRLRFSPGPGAHRRADAQGPPSLLRRPPDSPR